MFPDKFFDQLSAVLADAPPLPGEESRYATISAVLAATESDPELKKALIDEAMKCEEELVDPLLQFRNWGIQLGNGWSTTSNNAAFGTDYFTRTAVAKSNILVNAPRETKYLCRTSTPEENASTASTVTFLDLPKIKHHRRTGFGPSRSTTRLTSLCRTSSTVSRWARRTKERLPSS